MRQIENNDFTMSDAVKVTFWALLMAKISGADQTMFGRSLTWGQVFAPIFFVIGLWIAGILLLFVIVGGIMGYCFIRYGSDTDNWPGGKNYYSNKYTQSTPKPMSNPLNIPIYPPLPPPTRF